MENETEAGLVKAKIAADFIKEAAEFQKLAADLASKKQQLSNKFDGSECQPLLNSLLSFDPKPSPRMTYEGQLSFVTGMRATMSFLQSGVFYFFAGLCLLLYAAHQQQASVSSSLHPSLLFLLAILGMAILLFGTGSQSAAAIATGGARLPDFDEANAAAANPLDDTKTQISPEHPAAIAEASMRAAQDIAEKSTAQSIDAEKIAGLSRLIEPINVAVKAAEAARISAARSDNAKPQSQSSDWGPVKANAAVAGGAAVLAGLFGWGIMHYSDDIRKVFKLDDRYEKVYISACAAYREVCDPDTSITTALSTFTLADYEIGATLDTGVSIPLLREDRRIRLVLLSEDTRDSRYFWLTIKRTRNKTQDNAKFKAAFSLPIQLQPKKEEHLSDCVRFDGIDDACAASLRLTQLVNSEDRAKVKVYSLNFFAARDTSGLASETVVPARPDNTGLTPNPVPVEYDLTVPARSTP